MTWPLVTGVAPRWESALVTVLGTSGRVHVVRRCADVVELVGVARAGLARVALVSSDLRGLDREVVAALQEAGVHVVGVRPPGDEDGARRLRRWGVRVVVGSEVSAAELDAALAGLESGGEGEAPGRHPFIRQAEASFPQVTQVQGGGQPDRGEDAGMGTSGDLPTDPGDRDPAPRPEPDRDPGAGAGTDPDRDLGTDSGDAGPAEPEPGEVIVVWGAYGSPGRTTVAVNLAAELATPLEPVILVDADTYAASVAQWLAVLDEAPGVAAAARAADQGSLDAELLVQLAPEVRPGLRVLTGLPRADRWPELRDASLADVLEQCTRVARRVVVDVAPVVEQDEELSFDTRAPRRNGAALTALQAADRVVVVGVGDPVGLHRLVRCLDALPGLSAASRQVVVTRVRPGPVGPEPERRIRESLRRFAGAERVHLMPEDHEAMDAALLHGRLLLEVRPDSALRRSFRSLAGLVRGQELRDRRPRRRWLSRFTRRG
ncbi:CpaE family protein [Ornithinimicrobium sp. LYQ92]|uniref:AAA family ATPase n=1 Tax=Serinicoccus sp. LYQ92 TaxID=3378798 RepID=UPI00385452BB